MYRVFQHGSTNEIALHILFDTFGFSFSNNIMVLRYGDNGLNIFIVFESFYIIKFDTEIDYTSGEEYRRYVWRDKK
jgi:hypothetical protein